MVDIIIIAILILMMFIGYKRGFLKSLTGIVSIIVSFAVAMCLFTQVADFLKTTPVYEAIYDNVEKTVVSSEAESVDDEKNETSLGFMQGLISDVEESIEDVREGVASAIALKTTDFAVRILSAVLVFLIARIIVWLLMSVLGIVKKMPLIGWFDRWLGAILGFARGFLIVYIVLLLVAVSASFNSENTFAKAVNQSEFAKVMYNNNVFLDFIHKD